MNYLHERKQYVQINSNDSDLLVTGDQSVSQGSIASGLLYTIYTLDMHHQTHKMKHKNHKEYKECRNIMINTYVDDCYAVIETRKKNIWKKIERYIETMNRYYTNNKLQMNIKKTLVMILTEVKE